MKKYFISLLSILLKIRKIDDYLSTDLAIKLGNFFYLHFQYICSFNPSPFSLMFLVFFVCLLDSRISAVQADTLE